MSARRRVLPFVVAATLMARLYFKTLMRGRKMILVLVLLGLGILIAGVMAGRVSGQYRVEAYQAYLGQMTLGFMAQFASLFFGLAVVREEVDAGTLTYLVVRPLSRRSILVGRWLAAMLISVGLLVLFSLIVHAIAAPEVIPTPTWDAGAGAFGQFMDRVSERLEVPALTEVVLAAAVGAAFYTTAFTFVAVFLPKPLLFGLGYIIFWEFSLPFVPNNAATLSIKYHLINLANLPPPQAVPLIAPPEVATSQSILVICIATSVLALLALWRFPKREFLVVR